MTRDLRLTPDGDLLLPLQWVTGTELILQRIRVKLKIFRGEPLYSITSGMPWMTWLGDRRDRPSVDALALVVQGQILDIPGVATCTCTATEAGSSVAIRADLTTTEGVRAIYEIDPATTRRGNPGGIWMRLIAP